MRAVVIAFLGLAGCVGPDPNVAVDLMKGQGAASAAPDGSRSFRYVIPANAYRGVVDDPKSLAEQHKFLIGQWAATGCPRGYTIKDRQEIDGMVIYSGPCR